MAGTTTEAIRQPWLQRLGSRLLWPAVFLLILGAAYGRGLFRANQPLHAPGQVSRPHVVWENECSTCHVAGQSLSGRSWTSALVGQTGNSSRCSTCHTGATHSTKQSWEPSCSSCHQEHRGRDHDLRHVADRHCLQCHADLKAHLVPGAVTTIEDVPNLPDHPLFRLERAKPVDPGRLQFDHARHLRKGMPKQEGHPLTTLERVAADLRPRYNPKGLPLDTPLQLQCADCHRLDTQDLDQGTPRAAGEHLAAISYARDCRACHPLTVGGKDAGLLAPAIDFAHGRQPAELQQQLEGILFRRALVARQTELTKLLEKSALPLPGRQHDDPLPLGESLRHQLSGAGLLLFQGDRGCNLCHVFQAPPGQEAKQLLANGRYLDLTVVPTNLPQVWHPQARFSHVAHRAVDCVSCHPKAPSSSRHTDVLIPGRDLCLRCHGPVPAEAPATGRANGSCVECHRYHDSAHPLRGRAAASRNPKQRLDIDTFLKGAPGEPQP